MGCSYFEDRGGTFSCHPYCLKKNDYINDDLYYSYCRGYSYSDCPIYKNGGSSSGGCYLTSACVYAKGLTDNCYELETLRSYRDGWLRKQEHGETLIAKYYEVAPKIVSKLNEQADRASVYDMIYERMILPCVKLIEAGRNEDARALYQTITEELEAAYL